MHSTLESWRTRIDAKHNYWSYNESIAVSGRIRDQSDNPLFLEVDYRPFYMNNLTILDGGKCPPGWDAVADTCYMYVGAPMTYEDARRFCLVSFLHPELVNTLPRDFPYERKL